MINLFHTIGYNAKYLPTVGQTPRKLFNLPHPERYHHGLHSLPIGVLHGIEEDPHLLTQNSRCFRGEFEFENALIASEFRYHQQILVQRHQFASLYQTSSRRR